MKLQKISELFSIFFRTCFASISELFLGRSGCKDKGFPSKLPNIFRTFFAAFPAFFRHRAMNQRLSCENFLISLSPTNRSRNHAILIIYRYLFFGLSCAPQTPRLCTGDLLFQVEAASAVESAITAATECDSVLNFTHVGIFPASNGPDPELGASGYAADSVLEATSDGGVQVVPLADFLNRAGRSAQTIFSTVMSGSARRSSIKVSSPFVPLARMTSVARCTTPSGVRAASTS